MDEGHGEALFDVGLEDSGESMGFSKDEWDFAYERLIATAKSLNAECRVLMTHNVGGEYEVGTEGARDKSCSGKLMVRRTPDGVDDVIETRIAVVGNGTCNWAIGHIESGECADDVVKLMQAKAPCLGSWSREASMMGGERCESTFSDISTRSRVAGQVPWEWRLWVLTQREMRFRRLFRAENCRGKK